MDACLPILGEYNTENMGDQNRTVASVRRFLQMTLDLRIILVDLELEILLTTLGNMRPSSQVFT